MITENTKEIIQLKNKPVKVAYPGGDVYEGKDKEIDFEIGLTSEITNTNGKLKEVICLAADRDSIYKQNYRKSYQELFSDTVEQIISGIIQIEGYPEGSGTGALGAVQCVFSE